MTRRQGKRVAIVGGGWAGLSAAVQAVSDRHEVTLLEMSSSAGGRARTVSQHGQRLDNGQHILIGAYRATLGLLRQVGVNPDTALLRLPLCLTRPDGGGLSLRSPSTPASLLWSVLRHASWPWSSRLALMLATAHWAARGFKCPAGWTVQTLTRELPAEVREELIDPLCVSALNTLPEFASAQVFLRVLNDALWKETGGADLLLPRRPLSELLPMPAIGWLQGRGATIRLRQRVNDLQHRQGCWEVDGVPFDHVVLACPAAEAARLTDPIHPAWSMRARQLPQAAITTVYVGCAGARLNAPMVFLADGPAQFAFDHGAMGLEPGLFAFVISASEACAGMRNTQWAQSVLQQARDQFPRGTWPADLQIKGVFTEHRATFKCTAGLVRPSSDIAPGLSAAGDYVDGPYPSTLEGAVRSGQRAVQALS